MSKPDERQRAAAAVASSPVRSGATMVQRHRSPGSSAQSTARSPGEQQVAVSGQLSAHRTRARRTPASRRGTRRRPPRPPSPARSRCASSTAGTSAGTARNTASVSTYSVAHQRCLAEFHAAGPVARESPMVSAYSSALRSVSPTASREAADRAVVVRGRVGSRCRRAAGGCRTAHANSSVPAGSRPMRARDSRATSTPTTEWSPVAALGDVVEQRGEEQHVAPRARRATSPSKPAPSGSFGSRSAAHSATASSECRSTVKR